jgi:hypothetical protein
MLYCPNCSAYQYEKDATSCRKCGFDFSGYVETTPEVVVEDEASGKVKIPHRNYNADRLCNICGGPTRDIKGDIEISVEGERISIRGLKLMGGDISKTAVTQYTYQIIGYECREGHRFFSDFKCRVRPLCPVCYDPMMKYGSSLMSCSRCNKHFPVQSWAKPDEFEVLLMNDWEYIGD